MKGQNRRQQSSNMQQGDGTFHSPALLHGENDVQDWKKVAGPFGSHIASRTGLITGRLRQNIPVVSPNRRLLGPQVWRSDYPGLAVSELAGRIISPIQSLVGYIQSKFKRTTLPGRQGNELQWITRPGTRHIHTPGLGQIKFPYYTEGSVNSQVIPLEYKAGHADMDIVSNQVGELAETYNQPEEYTIQGNIGRIYKPFTETNSPPIINTKKSAWDIGRQGITSRFIQAESLLRTTDISLAKKYPSNQLHKVSPPTEEFKRDNIKGEIESQLPEIARYQDKHPLFIAGEQGYQHLYNSLSANIIRARETVGEIGRRIGTSMPHQANSKAGTRAQPFKGKSPSQEAVTGRNLRSPREKPGEMADQRHPQPNIFNRELEPAETEPETLPYNSRSGISGLSKEHNDLDTLTEPQLIEPQAEASATTRASKVISSLVGKTSPYSRMSAPSLTGERAGVGRISILPRQVFRTMSDSLVPSITRQRMIKRGEHRLATEAVEFLPLTQRLYTVSYKGLPSASSGLLSYAPSADSPTQSLYCSPFDDTREFGQLSKSESEIIAVTEGIPQVRHARSISTDQIPAEPGYRDFRQIERSHVYNPGQSSLTKRKTPTMRTLTNGTRSPMVQMAHAERKASDMKSHPNTFGGAVFSEGPSGYDTPATFLDRSMDESMINIMPQSETAETQSTEQSQKAEFDIDSFAQKVYGILKRQLAVERERRGV